MATSGLPNLKLIRNDPVMSQLPIIDTFGRIHSNLRISVTDRCNIRCIYCMPSEQVTFRPKMELLTFEEIERFVRIASQMGVHRLRLTGGEPLVRKHLSQLIGNLAQLPKITDIALTTNGLLLEEQAADLKAAGLHRLNVSLDCLDDDVFFRISRRRGTSKIVAGILRAKELGFHKIRLNSVIIPGFNESEIVGLAEFARRHGLELRFIEFMPLNAGGQWEMNQVLTGAMLRQIIERHVAPLRPAAGADPHQPARDFDYADGSGRVGFVDSVSAPFCSNCNRMRITADGQLCNCLFSDDHWDVRRLLRDPGARDEEIQAIIRECIQAKWAGHNIRSREFIKPQRAMHEIGG